MRRPIGRPRKPVEALPEGTITATRIFYETYAAEHPIVVNRGGARSSKSYSIAQVLAHKFFTERNKKILIVRKSLPSLRISTLLLWKEVLNSMGVFDQVDEEKVGLNYFFNNNMVHFGSIDDVEKIKCYHPDTEVLTANGWLPVAEVAIGDQLATLNPRTHQAEYRPVTRVFAYDYDGPMYSPKRKKRAPYIDFCVTPEHKLIGWPVRHQNGEWVVQQEPCFVPVNKKPGVFRVPRTAQWKGEHPEFFDLPSTGEEDTINKHKHSDRWNGLKSGRNPNRVPIQEWLAFLGWYLSEGSCSGGYGIQISQKEGPKLEKIKKAILGMGYSCWKGGGGACLSGKDLHHYLTNSCGQDSYTKRIPREVLNLDPGLLWHLFDSLVDGDGHRCKTGRVVYYTSSSQLKDDVCELAVKLGLTPTVRQNRVDYPSNFKNGTQGWTINIRYVEWSQVLTLTTTPYKGKVYCFEVPPYHTVLIRYNGRTMWCGQSTEWNYIWMEEATEFAFDDFKQLRLRTSAPSLDGIPNKLYLSFNPIDEYHWIKEKLINDNTFPVTEIISNYLDNPFLSPEYIQILEALRDQDPMFWQIYTLGEWGRLENLIYSNWGICDSIPDAAAMRWIMYGLDFGYNEPTALIRICGTGRDLWEKELLYHTKLTNSDLIEKLRELIPPSERRMPIYADAAEPDRIAEIRRAGFNAKPAQKNVNDGIDSVKRYSIHVHRDSTNIIKEKRAYSWRKDRNGNVLDVPVDFMNHLMDSERYGIYTHLKGGDNVVRLRALPG